MLYNRNFYDGVLRSRVLYDYDYVVHGNPLFDITLDNGMLCSNTLFYHIIYINIADSYRFYIHIIHYHVLCTNSSRSTSSATAS